MQKEIIALALDKVDKLAHRIENTLTKKRIGQKALQCLAGHLTWATNVIQWGRAFTNSIFQAIRRLKAATHKMRITPDVISDLQWWLSCLKFATPWRALWPAQQPIINIETDSCQASGGAFLKCSSAWVYTNWAIDRPALSNAHINTKELGMIREAIHCWGPTYPNHHLNIFCDNMTAVHITNTGAARNPLAARIIKDIAKLALKWNLTISANHIPGHLNELADSISRLHIPGQFYRFSTLLSKMHKPDYHPTYNLLCNMSPLTLCFLLPQVQKLQTLSNNWTMR